MPDNSTWPIRQQEESVLIELTSRRLFLLSVVLLACIKALSLLETYGLEIPLVREFFAVVFLTFIPGLFVLLQFDYQTESVATTVCYAFGLSIFLVMAIGGLTSVALPYVGVMQPLSLNMLIVTWVIFSGGTTVASSRTVTLGFNKERLRNPRLPFLLLLPTISVLGSVFYHVTGNNLVLLVLLTTLALIPMLAVTVEDETWYFALAIWCISLALLYHGRVPGYYTVTQPLPQVTLEYLRWIPNYGEGLGSLLANGVLFPTYAILTGLPIAIEWNLVNPILVSFLPVVLYETFRRHISPKEALIAACLFTFAYPFYVLYPSAGRAATPVIFLALLGLAYSDDRLPDKVQQLFLLAFAIGVAVSHYGTAYVVMFAFIVAIAAFITLRILLWVNLTTYLPTRFRDLLPGDWEAIAARDVNIGLPSILQPSFVAYYTVFALGWYLYTGLSRKFVILPRKVVDAIQGILYTQVTGSAVSSYQQDYAGVAITLGKYLYVVFGLLMTIGIGVAVVRLVLYREESIETGYLSVAIGFFSMFIGSALPSGNAFAVARVMMIIFTFAVPFAVVGAREIGSVVRWVFAQVDTGIPHWRSGLPNRATVSLVVAVFLLLNTGVVSEVVTHDTAPSNRISQERLLNSEDPDLRLRASACTRCNVQTHLWIGSQIPAEGTVYTGVVMGNQLDYYAGTLAERTSRGLHYTEVRSNQTDIPPSAYLAVLAHNQDLGGFAIGYKFDFYRKNMSSFTSGSRLYTNGYGAIYREAEVNKTVS